ncbi:MAG TPA: phosphatase PAP2 family protein [Gemmatimonadaceae bacterium]|nr:phosphatase PAP2 family protein [Gemmatimonadaceae bacterium]
MARAFIFTAALTFTALASIASAQTDPVFTRPRFLESVRGVPGTLADAARSTAHKSNIAKAVAVVASTVALYAGDDQIYAEAKRFGRRIDIAPSHPTWSLKAGDVKLFYVPTTVSSALYYLGDGWTTMGIAGSFFAAGAIRGDNRALRTASEITESMFALGLVTQTLKHATGRQTPGAATASRGEWHPFAPWREYSATTPKYDAFPSGHLATAMATVTVIAWNYPDRHWIRPVGYSLMGVLGFAMVNNGVHWASDYPLALAIGGTVGAAAARRGRPPSMTNGNAERIAPLIRRDALGVTMSW